MKIFGIVGLLLLQMAYWPQILKIWRYRRTGGISLIKYSMVLLGLFFLMLYAISIQDMVYIVDGAVSVFGCAVTMVSVILIRRKEGER